MLKRCVALTRVLVVAVSLIAQPICAGADLRLDASSSRIGFQLEPGGKLISPVGQEVDLKPLHPFTDLQARYKDGAWEIALSNGAGDHATVRFSLDDFGLTVDQTAPGGHGSHIRLATDPKLAETLRIWSTGVDPLPKQGRVAELRDHARQLAIIELPSGKTVQQTDLNAPEGVHLALVAGRYLVATSDAAGAFSGGDQFSGGASGSKLLLDLSNYLPADAQSTEYCSWAIAKPGFSQSAKKLPLGQLIRDFVRVDERVLP